MFKEFIEDMQTQKLETEEEINEYINKRVLDEWNKSMRKANKESRANALKRASKEALNDPLYKFMKEELPTDSRIQNFFYLSPEEERRYYEYVED